MGLSDDRNYARYHQQQGHQHKKVTDWARQMILSASGGRRWLPHRSLVLVGDAESLAARASKNPRTRTMLSFRRHKAQEGWCHACRSL